jgi:hypothetical protein
MYSQVIRFMSDRALIQEFRLVRDGGLTGLARCCVEAMSARGIDEWSAW